MSKRRSLPCATWYEAFHCWTDPGECNEDHPVSDSLGVYRTFGQAERAYKKKSLKLLTPAQHREFNNRMGNEGAVIVEHLVVFTTESRTRGVKVAADKLIELTAPKQSRQKAFLRKASKLGIPESAIRLDQIPGF
jgi:hypothetical protein